MVLRRCKKLLGDKEAAADAMHDVFVKLAEQQPRLREDAVSSLLYRMATNTCLNLIRTRRRRPETPSEELLETIASMEELESRALASRLIDQIFKREKPSTRTIAALHFVDRMTVREVAEMIGMTVSQVNERIRNLRKHARELQEVDP